MNEYGPCGAWPTTWTCDVSTHAPTVTAEAASFATEVVWALTGRQFGLCEVTLRPCRRECRDYPFPDDLAPFPGYRSLLGPDGGHVAVSCGGCLSECSCGRVSEVALPAPVHEVVEVLVDGAALPASAYRLDDDRILVRTDGGEWPRCNDLTQGDDQLGTWSVTATYGVPVPEGGSWAVGELACELLRARSGEDCRLPNSVTQLVRQGVTLQFPVVAEMLQRGQTGLYLVDLFVATWNPNGLRRRAGVYRVDGPSHRRAGT